MPRDELVRFERRHRLMGTSLVFMPVVIHVSLRDTDADAIALKLKKWSSRENGDTPAGWLGEA